jgi:hypothetical protein
MDLYLTCYQKGCQCEHANIRGYCNISYCIKQLPNITVTISNKTEEYEKEKK